MAPLTFGLNPDEYDFESSDQAPDGSADGSDLYFQRAQRALEARNMIARDIEGQQEGPPKPVSLPRVDAKAKGTSFIDEHPGAAKWFDLAFGLAAMKHNRNTQKKARREGNRNPKYVQLSDFPSYSKIVEARKNAAEKDASKTAEENAKIAEQEARINDNAQTRYRNSLNTSIGQMVPSLTRASMRDPREDRAAPVFQQRLAALKQSQAYLDASPKDRTAMELHVIGGEPKTAESTADAYNKAYARLQSKLDFQKKNPAAGGGRDVAEIDFADMSKYMADLIHNDFVDPEKAADMALEFGRNKMKLRTSLKGKESTMKPAPGDIGGRPLSPGGADQTVPPPGTPGVGPLPSHVQPKQSIAGLPPDLADKLRVYAAQKNRHGVDDTGKIAQIREMILREYGVDPDKYLEPGQ